MKNQNKIESNISKSDEKQVNSKDTLNEVSNNIDQNSLNVQNSNENFKEISIDKALSKKNEQNYGLNSKLKDLISEGKSEIKINFNIPVENNILQSLKDNFVGRNINEINQNQNKIYSESQIRIQTDNLNLNNSMISDSNILEKNNNLILLDNLFNHFGEKQV